MAVRAKIGDIAAPRKAPLQAVPSKRAAAATSRARAQSHALSTEAEFVSYRNLIDRTVEVFGDELKASRWLSLPSADLAGKVPLEVAQSVHYASSELQRIFEPVFVRIEHGIYT